MEYNLQANVVLTPYNPDWPLPSEVFQLFSAAELRSLMYISLVRMRALGFRELSVTSNIIIIIAVVIVIIIFIVQYQAASQVIKFTLH